MQVSWLRRSMAKSGPSRVLHFVRHGQYTRSADGADEGLTGLGRKQARRLALHFRHLPIDSIVSSDAPRAFETATILARDLRLQMLPPRPLLSEIMPIVVTGYPTRNRLEDKRRLERVVVQLFKPSRTTRHEVIVCHGNLIRSVMCLVTGAPVADFGRASSHHAGITCFEISARGIWLVSYNELGHLPRALRSG
jgi:serine/threonine-protein phosphatase PGAM5